MHQKLWLYNKRPQHSMKYNINHLKYILLVVKCAVALEFTHGVSWELPAHATCMQQFSWVTDHTHKFNTAPHVHIVHAAHGIARVHNENKNIVLLLLKIVKFIKYFFDLIIYTSNTLNELAIFDWQRMLCTSVDRRECLRLLRVAFGYCTLCGINCYGWFAKKALMSTQSFLQKNHKSNHGSSCSLWPPHIVLNIHSLM